MYCPRCGNAVTETTKFCKSCGLSLAPVTSYVASGGTGALAPQAPQAAQPAGMPPSQKMVLAILFFVFAPAIFAVLGKGLGAEEAGRMLAAIFGVLMVPGIIWSVFYFKARQREWEQQGATPQGSQPSATHALPPPAYQPPLPPQRTNPLAEVPRRPVGSVAEDETRRLPEN
jgi:hypothetical protein